MSEVIPRVRLRGTPSFVEALARAVGPAASEPAEVLVVDDPALTDDGLPVLLVRSEAPPERVLDRVTAWVREPSEVAAGAARAWLRGGSGLRPGATRWLAAVRAAIGADAVAWDEARARAEGPLHPLVVPFGGGWLAVRCPAEGAADCWEALRGLLPVGVAGPSDPLRQLAHDVRSPAFALRLAARVIRAQGSEQALADRIENAAATILAAVDQARVAARSAGEPD